jgi:glycosyltransferase involved in cell wall biosynthesis
MSAEVTTAICARNASATIERAVRSAVLQGGPVLLVDDGSVDGTADIAARAGGNALTVVRPPEHRTLGYARQAAVDAVTTDWILWLDADDEVLPGRAAHLLRLAADHRWDAVWDAVELFAGETGTLVGELPMPPWMVVPGAAVRQFERNHAPGPAWPLVSTRLARMVGYDPVLPTADDLDFMLRACTTGAELGFVTSVGYRQYAYRDSLSRDLAHQRFWASQVLRKHEYEDVRRLYLRSGHDGRVAAWALVSMALFRDEPSAALGWLELASPASADASEVLEAGGPWPSPEGWRRAFQRGTILLLLGGRDREAVGELQRAETIEPTAEGANNLGVALRRLGDGGAAATCFAEAQRRFPGFLDAQLNAESVHAARVTTHPLRRLASRSQYG